MLPWLWRQIAQHLPPPPPPPPIPGGDQLTPESVFHDAAARFLDVQISTNDVLDTRATSFFWVGSSIVTITFALLNLFPSGVCTAVEVILVLSLVAYVLVLGCVGRAGRLRGLEYRPDLPTIERHSRAYQGDALARWVAQEYMASTEANKPALARKAFWVGLAGLALYAEGLLLSIAAILALL